MGDLHAVFCFFKVLRKMIDGSGLDQAFEEARNLFDFFYSIIFRKVFVFSAPSTKSMPNQI